MNGTKFFARYGFIPSDRMRAVYEAANQRLARERGVVYASSAARFLASKADLRRLLRDAGLPKAAAQRVADAGWPALSPETDANELADALRRATAKLRAEK